MTNPQEPEYRDPVLHPDAERLARIKEADSNLANRVEDLRQTLAELSPEVTKLQKDQRSVWTWLKGGAGFIAFDIIITVLGIVYGVYLHKVQSNNDALLEQVKHDQARLDTSIRETCTLYGTFIGFYSDAAKARFVGGPQQYDQLYITLQTSADHLQCGIKHAVPGT